MDSKKITGVMCSMQVTAG